MYYKSTDDQIYVCKGAALGWKAVGGGVSFTYYCFLNSTLGNPVCINTGGNQGYCPAGYQQRLVLGAWGTCNHAVYGDYNDYWFPPGGSCGSSAIVYATIGQAYVCSQ
ncbi:MAG: hypothetical protein Q8N62_04290 [Candidatus Omnitrophota bacterium]|nr:hypothetical protein [Candidatus Omnitrophota bacterium]